MLKKSYYTEECYEDAKSFLERATKEEERVSGKSSDLKTRNSRFHVVYKSKRPKWQ